MRHFAIAFLEDVVAHSMTEKSTEVNLVQSAHCRYRFKASLLFQRKSRVYLIVINSLKAQGVIWAYSL